MQAREILRGSDFQYPLQNAEMLVRSLIANQEIVEVTGVEINSIDKGLEIILETTKGEQLQIIPKQDDNAYLVDIAALHKCGMN
ncbi:hypothetical protein ACN23B_24565 [Anabaena sp. FACHB-709]|uniref:Uncharacterized protein n=2 Tax=Nostocaceae TaxID=1162 RepID=A0A1Z4KNC3_ANAVA|nr:MULTISPECIES: hypothetical protein [Nostocaceae]BAY70505.1 hypothetical protein NIES23_33090 [Trichormus variabilis NIES-23]HBW32279.1 hypothetical protein [Nostoc sp. UBA8866]MBD2173217.1 hypothetical protein [Anabaena cylindrica FACHB-318]MBD2264968.1 hypothetical protein [Anabaena sp. FACHB-709]MBD2274278.1 hypothetical protein [Nostoc sp. PCC 7120 = FACHB-418]